MKTFIALTFIGILTYAYGATTGISECKTVTPMDGFSATRFFTRTWYVTHVQKKTSNTVCQTFTASKPSNTTYAVDYTFTGDNGENNVHCVATRTEEKKLTFNCKNGDTPIFDAVFVIMATDYNNYALFYRCVTMKSSRVKDDNFLVLSSTSGDQAIPASLTSLTSSLGLKSCEEIKTMVY
uniref:Salivary lipocalin 4 n=1 Tax=Triatoma matogrossensis TaxID=162370 RepID=E2J747_9HEMI